MTVHCIQFIAGFPTWVVAVQFIAGFPPSDVNKEDSSQYGQDGERTNKGDKPGLMDAPGKGEIQSVDILISEARISKVRLDSKETQVYEV